MLFFRKVYLQQTPVIAIWLYGCGSHLFSAAVDLDALSGDIGSGIAGQKADQLCVFPVGTGAAGEAQLCGSVCVNVGVF